MVILEIQKHFLHQDYSLDLGHLLLVYFDVIFLSARLTKNKITIIWSRDETKHALFNNQIIEQAF